MLPEAVPARELIRLTADWRVVDDGDAWCLERRMIDGWHLWHGFRHRKNLLTFVHERIGMVDLQVRRQLWHWPERYSGVAGPRRRGPRYAERYITNL